MQDGNLMGKFMVERADGSIDEASRFFVLDYATDPHARAALVAYAQSCAATHPVLANDLRTAAGYFEVPAVSDSTPGTIVSTL